MGVIYTHIYSDFFMPVTNSDKALKDLKILIKKNPFFAWMPDLVMTSSSLKDCLWNLGFVIENDEDGNIIEIRFGGDKIPEDGPYTVSAIFDKIAKYVKKGSKYILADEYNTFYEYYFSNTFIRLYTTLRGEYDALIMEAIYNMRNMPYDHKDPEKTKKSIALLTLASKLVPDCGIAWHELAIVHARLNEWELAWEHCVKWENAKSYTYKFEDTVGLKYENGVGNTYYNPYYQVAERAMSDSCFEIAMKFFEKASTIIPNDMYLLSNLSETYFKLEEYEKCHMYAKKYAELNPKSYKGYYYMGHSSLFLKEYDDAENNILLTIKYHNKWFYPKLLLTEIYYYQKSKKVSTYSNKLILSTEKNITQNKELDWNYSYLARIYRYRRELNKAEEYIIKALEQNPNNTYFNYVYALILIDKNEKDKAVPELEKCLRKYPKWKLVLAEYTKLK